MSGSFDHKLFSFGLKARSISTFEFVMFKSHYWQWSCFNCYLIWIHQHLIKILIWHNMYILFYCMLWNYIIIKHFKIIGMVIKCLLWFLEPCELFTTSTRLAPSGRGSAQPDLPLRSTNITKRRAYLALWLSMANSGVFQAVPACISPLAKQRPWKYWLSRRACESPKIHNMVCSVINLK